MEVMTFVAVMMIFVNMHYQNRPPKTSHIHRSPAAVDPLFVKAQEQVLEIKINAILDHFDIDWLARCGIPEGFMEAIHAGDRGRAITLYPKATNGSTYEARAVVDAAMRSEARRGNG